VNAGIPALTAFRCQSGARQVRRAPVTGRDAR
jgi:hypothetical protein